MNGMQAYIRNDGVIVPAFEIVALDQLSGGSQKADQD